MTRLAAELELQSGARMNRAEFHRIYTHMPADFKAELIGGVVHVASPLKRPHGTMHPPLSTLFFSYAGSTPGVETGDNATILLGPRGEPQPDLYLRTLPNWGGQSRTRKGFVVGPPELIAEIADSSRSTDLHGKFADYLRYGVLEYLVVCLREKELRWFDLQNNREMRPAGDGIYRMQTFPGLWIHGPALLAKNYRAMMETLHAGLASPEHAGFVKKLETARKRRKR